MPARRRTGVAVSLLIAMMVALAAALPAQSRAATIGSGPVADPAPAADEPSPTVGGVPASTPRPTPVVAGPVAPTPTPPVDFGPPPACAYKDLTTSRRSYGHYATTLLDTVYMLTRTYYPSDLVGTGLSGGGSVRRVALADLRAMDLAARAAGARFAVRSAFRSFATQVATFNQWVSLVGYSAALRTSARPGHSEHQLGTTVDFQSYGGAAPWTYSDWAATKAGAWLKANAWKFGWVMSYPKGKAATTCYSYEPWHFRYVGRDEAKLIHSTGLAPREWIWKRYGS